MPIILGPTLMKLYQDKEPGSGSGTSTAGQPMGLLLALTKAT